MIYPKVEKIKQIKEEIRTALNFANVITPPNFPFVGYERQIRRTPDEQIPNFYYTLDSNDNIESITIIFDNKVHWYNIWYESNTTIPTVPKYKLIYQGSIDFNLSNTQTHWSSPCLEYLESQNEELIYSGSNPYSFEVQEVKFPKLKTFSFPKNFAPNGTFTLETFPLLESFNGNSFQSDTESTFSKIEMKFLKEFNGSLIPNNENIGLIDLPVCDYFVGNFGKAKKYNLPMLGTLSGGLFNSNTQLEEVKLGILTSMDFSQYFNQVNKQTFRLYVKNGSDASIVKRLTDSGLEVVYYG